MDFLKKNFKNLIFAIVTLIIGILCIIADAANSSGAFEGISITIGVTLIIVASLALLAALIASILSKKALLGTSVGAGTLLGTGIFFVSDKLVGGLLIEYLIKLIPFILIVTGCIIIVDAILTLVFGFVNKNVKESVISFVVSAIVGGVTLLLGILTIGNDPVIEKQLLIFGIIVVLMSILLVLSCFLNVSSTIVVVNKKSE